MAFEWVHHVKFIGDRIQNNELVAFGAHDHTGLIEPLGTKNCLVSKGKKNSGSDMKSKRIYVIEYVTLIYIRRCKTIFVFFQCEWNLTGKMVCVDG